jgi:glyoxylase-like metal-dependent hydrolase (beta-lactamase superfamily II)
MGFLKMEKVYPGIYRLIEKGALRNLKPQENIYIFAGFDGIICDAGYGNKKTVLKLIQDIRKIEDLFKKQGNAFKINRVLVSHSHPDHFSGLKLLRKHLGVKVILTKKMAEVVKDKKSFIKTHHASPQDMMQTHSWTFKSFWTGLHNILRAYFFKSLFGLSFLKNPDILIEENSEISINGEKWRIFPSPGHASDHISLYSEEKGVLFAGDNILRRITTWLGPPDSDLHNYIQSLEYISNLPNLKLILSSHGGPITNPRKRIKEVLNHRLRRTQQIKEVINTWESQGITPTEIIRALYPNAQKMKQELVRGWVVLTLEYLEEKNQIRREMGKKGIKFFPL